MQDEPNCCGPSREVDDSGEEVTGKSTPLSTAPASTDDDRTNGMVRVDGGSFLMGTNSDEGFPADGEKPARKVIVDSIYVDKHAVTNAQFAEFVRETGYTTEAERFGWSFVFEDFVAASDQDHVLQNVPAAPWWVAVRGADWFHPYGPGSTAIDNDLLKHPVVHISWRDAAAYAEWAGKRLPTEAEWEYTARGGCEQTRFPWGDELEPDGEHRCNVWQGDFPDHNTSDDGYVGTAPVNAFRPNEHGVYNVSGNVWEWCRDWFSPDYHTTDAYDPDNPAGPEAGDERVMRGGSYLCHESWCNRYRLPARSKNTPDSSTGNIGFRCVVDAA